MNLRGDEPGSWESILRKSQDLQRRRRDEAGRGGAGSAEAAITLNNTAACVYFNVGYFVSVPGEPGDIKALVMDSESIMLSWRSPRHPNGILRKYKIYMRSLDGMGLVCCCCVARGVALEMLGVQESCRHHVTWPIIIITIKRDYADRFPPAKLGVHAPIRNYSLISLA